MCYITEFFMLFHKISIFHFKVFAKLKFSLHSKQTWYCHGFRIRQLYHIFKNRQLNFKSSFWSNLVSWSKMMLTKFCFLRQMRFFNIYLFGLTKFLQWHINIWSVFNTKKIRFHTRRIFTFWLHFFGYHPTKHSVLRNWAHCQWSQFYHILNY